MIQEFNILDCNIEILKFGYNEETKSSKELYCFQHPHYYLANEDIYIGRLFEEYKKCFVIFDINLN